MAYSQQLFNPVVSLTIDDQLYSNNSGNGYRISFEIKRKFNKFPDPATITVYNINAFTRENFTLGAQVILAAGWDGSSEILYTGTLVDVRPMRDGPNWAISIISADGDAAFQRSVNQSFAKGVALSVVVGKLASAMGLALPTSAQVLLKDKVTTGALVHSGPAQMSLQTLLDPFDLHYSMQDGALLILEGNEPTAETAVLLSESTGLIGSPERIASKKKQVKGQSKAKAVTYATRVKIKATLQASIKPGRKLQLQSEILQGLYRIDEVVYKGDTHSADWYAEAICRAVT